MPAIRTDPLAALSEQLEESVNYESDENFETRQLLDSICASVENVVADFEFDTAQLDLS